MRFLLLTMLFCSSCGKQKADVIESPQPQLAQELADLRAEMLQRFQDISVDVANGKRINQADLEDAYTFYKSMCASLYAPVVDPLMEAQEVDECIDKNMVPFINNFNGEHSNDEI